MSIVLILIAVLAIFAAAWVWMPTGWLTATTGTVGAALIATHESVLEMLPALKAAVPPEHQHWLTVVVLLLTVAARFRKRAEQ
jgi:hypothetical protein